MKPFNIFDATGNYSTGWSSTEKLSETAISAVLDKAARSASSLNAIPSPFSRLHIFETAFKFVVKDIVEKKDRASSVYKELVSDCLDALELIFNWQYHESQGAHLTVENWHPEDLQKFSPNNKGGKVYAKTLKLFLKQDFAPDFAGFSIVKYKGMVIGASSPLSLIFTSPNLDKIRGEFLTPFYRDNFDLVNPTTNAVYFTKVRPFRYRSEAFKTYMASFFGTNPSLKITAKGVWSYLVAEGVEQLDNERRPVVKNVVTKNGGSFSINEFPFCANNDPGATDIFYDHIIKVNYRIDDSKFYTPKYVSDNEERDYDYLLPIKESFLKTLDLKQLPNLISFEETGASTIKVSYKGAIDTPSRSRVYTTNRSDKRDGQLIDIQNDIRLNFTIGIFPFLRVTDTNGIPKENTFYKVLYGVDAQSADPATLNTAKFSLDFYKATEDGFELIGTEGANYNAKRSERRKFEHQDNIASIYYQLTNTSFDVIKVNFPPAFETSKVNGLVIPKWTDKIIGNKSFSYSVDFGTTNTFIAYTDDTEHRSTPLAFDIKSIDTQMVMLQKPKKQLGGQSVISTYRNGNLFAINDSLINHEFVPPVLIAEKDSFYSMPFRTAIFQKKSISRFELFSDLNIHFTYQKAVLDANTNMTQEIIANIKWDITNPKDHGSKLRVEAFIKELCYLIRFKTILNDGDPCNTQINWFIPQSLSYAAKEAYKDIWATHVRNILGSTLSTKMVFESEAPYYYLKKQANIKDASSVLSLDIGGGSTDAMLFVNDLPRIGTSFNFAGNVLWSNGHVQLTNDAKENGIYSGIKEAMDKKISQVQDPLIVQNSHYFTKMSSDEIINFWLSNDDKLNVVEELNNPSFKILYLIHFCAIIYHTAQWLKQKKQPVPTCIIFSGNGSKYIDLLSKGELLSKIAGFVIEKIYQAGEANPQIILPKDNRKEATCFGGIFKDRNINFEPGSYLGTEIEFLHLDDVKKYKNVQEHLTDIKSSVNKNVNELFSVIQDLNNFLPFKSHLNIDINLPALLKFVSTRVDSNFDLGYGIRKEKVDLDEEVSDSLFFYPLIGVIFEIGKLDKKELNYHTPKIFKYSSSPTSDNVFLVSSVTEESTINSNFQVAVSSADPDEATYDLINDPKIHQRAYTSFEAVLKPVCFCEKFPADPSVIVARTINQGQLRKDGDQWVVTERLKIAFD